MAPMIRPGGGRTASCLRLLVLLFGILSCLHVATARPAPAAASGPHLHQHPPDGATWRAFKHLQDARRGSNMAGIADLKRYLARFGYMEQRPAHDDEFDEHMEVAVKRYQSRLSLPITGRLDSATLGRIMTPRCGVEDVHDASHGGAMSVSLSEKAAAVRRFTFFDGEPRWTSPYPLRLTYSISPTTATAVVYLPPDAVRDVFRSAFARWARVIPVEFVESDDYSVRADIRIRFYEGRHGDRSPFNGPGGVLAHSEAPLRGGIHFDATEYWTVDLDREPPGVAMDLESVATHEIGHVLGLLHSSSPEAIMYPYITRGERKVELTADDIEGVQLLYGSNPRFNHPVSLGRSNSFPRSVGLVCVALVMLVTRL